MQKRKPQPIYIFKANIYKHQYKHSTRTDKGFCLVQIMCSDHWQCMWSQIVSFGQIIANLGAFTYYNKIGNFEKKLNFWKCWAVIIDNSCDPKFSSVLVLSYHFVLSLTVSDISANLCFLKFLKIFENFRNVQKYYKQTRKQKTHANKREKKII